MAKLSLLKALSTVVGFLIIGGMSYGAWFIWGLFVEALQRADPSVVAAVIGAMATAIVGIGGVLLTQTQTKNREIEEAHRPKKVDIYQRFLEMVARLMAEQNPHVSLSPPSQQELVDFLVGFKTNVILWGSPEVIKAQLAFEAASNTGKNVLLAADKLYLAIRADLGLSNKGLNNHQLIRMYLKDPSELDRLSESNIALQPTQTTSCGSTG